MAKLATKTATKAPPPRPAGKPTATRAQQAARHQGRDPEPEAPRKTTVPATPAARPQQEVANYGSSASVPAHMRADVGMGKENIGREDIETPRLKLMQGLSPELESYNDLRAGNFFHTSSETIFDEPFRAVPVFMDRRYILWRPRDAGGGILARADDGIHWSPASGNLEVQLDKKDGGAKVVWKLAKTVQQSGLANWGTMDPNDPNSPPAATLMYSYVLAFPDNPDLMPAVLTFQRSSIKMGRRFNTKLKTIRTPLFGSVFEFRSWQDTNSRGQDFYNVEVRGAGLVEDPGLYETYKAMHMSFKDAGLTIKDLESAQDEDAGDNASDDAPGSGPAY